MISISFKGLVAINSKVPLLNSSENERMVIAGIRNKNTHGEMKKKASKEAKPYSNMIVSEKNIHRNKLLKTRNRPMAM